MAAGKASTAVGGAASVGVYTGVCASGVDVCGVCVSVAGVDAVLLSDAGVAAGVADWDDPELPPQAVSMSVNDQADKWMMRFK